MLLRLLFAAVALWALFTFTEAILIWGATAAAYLLSHVQVTIS